jgi:Heterokaryon incompatibility protein (HET)
MVSPDYMTLSYRWGSLRNLQLTQSNFHEMRKGKPIDQLPKTFRDAVTVAHRFSVRYLCIMQDSQEDFERESSTMRDVYSNSCCKISATASSDASGGLFRKGQKDSIHPGLIVTNDGSIQNRYYLFDQSYWVCQVSSTVLNQREWGFQERLLAPRVLHFAEHQIFWECFTEQKCEGFSQGIPFQKSIESLFHPVARERSLMHVGVFDFWRNIVQSYTMSELARPEDKVIALSGLAHLFQEVTGDQYLAGLWKSRLVDLMM